MVHLENIIKMMLMLKKNQIVKCKEIADKLGVKERQVRKYREVLSEFVVIESIPGRYGGYLLKHDAMFPIKDILKEDEIELIKEFINEIDYNLLENNMELKRAIEKINYTIENNEENNSSSIIPYSRIKPRDEKYKKVKADVQVACINSNELIIEYRDNKGKISDRRIQPYKIIMYKGDYYLYAFCLQKFALRNFKLTRINRCIVTSRKFIKDKLIEEKIQEEAKNSIGIFGGPEYDLELLIRNPMANTVKERIWVDNQIIDEESYLDGIVFKAKMKGEPEILSWILSMGESVTIVKPEELKLKMKQKLEKMIENLYIEQH